MDKEDTTKIKVRVDRLTMITTNQEKTVIEIRKLEKVSHENNEIIVSQENNVSNGNPGKSVNLVTVSLVITAITAITANIASTVLQRSMLYINLKVRNA